MLPFSLSFNREIEPTPGLALCGRFTGSIAILSLPTKVVSAWLPRRRKYLLVSQKEPDLHPVLVMLGQQLEIHHRWGKFRVDYSFGKQYDELVIAIPDVISSDLKSIGPSETHCCFYASLHLNAAMSTALGRFLYGFRKHNAVIETNPSRFDVLGNSGQKLFSAQIRAQREITEEVQNEELMCFKRFFAQPVITSGRRGGLFKFDYEFSQAPRPIELDIKIRPGMMGNRPLPPFTLTGGTTGTGVRSAYCGVMKWSCMRQTTVAKSDRKSA